MGLVSVACAAMVVSLVMASVDSQSYKNHTVGDAAGWVFNADTNTSSADYTEWASGQAFGLGDFLIFNTTPNQTVIQTYNQTTYSSCLIDDSLDTDTFVYSGGNNNDTIKQLIIPVPLTIEGPNYFFSDADDGLQCAQGLAFQINVTRGIGLPPSLNQPPPPPYESPPPEGSPPSPPFGVPSDQNEEFFNNGGLRDGGSFHLGVLVLVFVFGLLI